MFARSEEDELHRVAPDRAEEFGLFFEAHFSGVRSFVRARVRGEQEVEDICGDVFEIAWRRFPELATLPDFRARRWLLRTAELRCCTHHRSQVRRMAAMDRLTGRSGAPIDTTDEWWQTTVSAAEAREVAAMVRTVLESLRPSDRQILQMDALAELSSREIAVALGITPVAARLRLMRARRVFRAAYLAALARRDVEPERWA